MKTWKKIAIIVGAMVIVGAVIIIVVYQSKNNKPAQTSANAKPEMQVRAKRIWTDFSANPDIANKRFTGKVIQFDGQITRVEANDSICQVIFAYKAGKSGDEGMRVFMLPQYCDEAKHINPFKPIMLK